MSTLKEKFENAKNEYENMRDYYISQQEILKNEKPWVQDNMLRTIARVLEQKKCLFFDLKNKINYRKNNAQSRFEKI